MCTREGRVVVLDFGIALREAPTPELTTSTVGSPGTVGYMSPEQLRDLPLDGRTDLFALGIVLYELVTGRHPFGARGTAAVVERGAGRSAGPFSEAERARIPSGLEAIIDTALAKRPDDRFSSAGAMATAVRAVRDRHSTDPVAAAPTPPRPPVEAGAVYWWQVPRARRRHRVLAAADPGLGGPRLHPVRGLAPARLPAARHAVRRAHAAAAPVVRAAGPAGPRARLPCALLAVDPARRRGLRADADRDRCTARPEPSRAGRCSSWPSASEARSSPPSSSRTRPRTRSPRCAGPARPEACGDGRRGLRDSPGAGRRELGGDAGERSRAAQAAAAKSCSMRAEDRWPFRTCARWHSPPSSPSRAASRSSGAARPRRAAAPAPSGRRRGGSAAGGARGAFRAQRELLDRRRARSVHAHARRARGPDLAQHQRAAGQRAAVSPLLQRLGEHRVDVDARGGPGPGRGRRTPRDTATGARSTSPRSACWPPRRRRSPTSPPPGASSRRTTATRTIGR